MGFMSLSAGSQLSCKFKSATWQKGNFKGRDYQTCFIENEAVASSDLTIEIFSKDTAQAVWTQYNSRVKNIPSNIAALPLLAVNFCYCAISSVGNLFKGLRELIFLDLGGNKIENIQRDAFVDNIKLEWLGLGSNKLKRVHSDFFKTLSNLVSLFLHSNLIEFVEPSAFFNLINLEELHLTSNKLTFIDSKTFQGPMKLKIFHLGENEIDSMEPNAFEEIRSLKTLYLTNNVCLGKNYDSTSLNALKNDVRTNCNLVSIPRFEFKIKEIKEQCNLNELTKKISTSEKNLNSEMKTEILNLNAKLTTEVLNFNTIQTLLLKQ